MRVTNLKQYRVAKNWYLNIYLYLSVVSPIEKNLMIEHIQKEDRMKDDQRSALLLIIFTFFKFYFSFLFEIKLIKW